jgi:3-hydroxyisobutyrate dehydrogenase-like beta-hydroxyacid dehydrogenase
MEMARQLQAPALLLSLGTQLYRAAASTGFGQKDTSSMVQFLSSLGGVDF